MLVIFLLSCTGLCVPIRYATSHGVRVFTNSRGFCYFRKFGRRDLSRTEVDDRKNNTNKQFP